MPLLGISHTNCSQRGLGLTLEDFQTAETKEVVASGQLGHIITRRTVLKSTGAVAVSLGAGACAQKQGGQNQAAPKLAIIHTNDIHGHDLLNEESLGLAAAKQLQKDYEAKGYEVLLLDAGDTVQGDIMVDYSKGDAAIDFFNLCVYDAMAIGNHEFDYGQDKFYDYIMGANFPLLSASVIVDAAGQLMFTPRTTFTLADGTMVGVFGLTTPATYTTANPRSHARYPSDWYQAKTMLPATTHIATNSAKLMATRIAGRTSRLHVSGNASRSL